MHISSFVLSSPKFSNKCKINNLDNVFVMNTLILCHLSDYLGNVFNQNRFLNWLQKRHRDSMNDTKHNIGFWKLVFPTQKNNQEKKVSQ